jgi:SAM-dependent methyltransferase
MPGIYDVAEVYHYGFAFRNNAAEAGLLIEASRRFGTGGPRFLEIACGDCPYALELAQAGVEYHGLDLSAAMLEFSIARLRAQGLDLTGRLHQADMRDFRLAHSFDAAFVLMGSLHYLDNEGFLAHLDALHAHLNPGGTYVLEWCVEFMPNTKLESSWTQPSPLGEIGVRYRQVQKCPVRQTFGERAELTVNGDPVAVSESVIHRRYANEFSLLLDTRRDRWELLGHYLDWDLNVPLQAGSEKIERPLTILRTRSA